jgi:hemerythrin-like domain-containing protein
MKQERYNIFKRPHKGLSSMVFDAGTRIQQTDFTNLKEGKATIPFIGQAVRSFEYHINNEDTVIFNAVANAAPFIVAMMEKTNAKDLQLAFTIGEKLEEYKILYNKQNMAGFGVDLQTVFFAFTSVVLQHIKKEETVINELLWSDYDDSQLIEMDAGIIKQLPPGEHAWYTSRILKWLTNQEIIIWITGIMEYGNPCEAESLLQTAQSVLPGERWQMISRDFSMQRA